MSSSKDVIRSYVHSLFLAILLCEIRRDFLPTFFYGEWVTIQPKRNQLCLFFQQLALAGDGKRVFVVRGHGRICCLIN